VQQGDIRRERCDEKRSALLIAEFLQLFAQLTRQKRRYDRAAAVGLVRTRQVAAYFQTSIAIQLFLPENQLLSDFVTLQKFLLPHHEIAVLNRQLRQR